MDSGTGMHIDVRMHCADQAAVPFSALDPHIGQSLGMRFLVQAKIMTICVDCRPSSLQLGPPVRHWHGKEFIGSSQGRKHLLFPLDVPLLSSISISVSIAKCLAAVLLTSRMKNLCQHREYIHGTDIHPTVDKCGHIGARLFYIMRNSSATAIENQTAVVQGLLTCRLRGHDSNQSTRRALLVKVAQFLQRKISANISVQYEEGSGLPALI